ncbi:MAG TPA: histidine kinase [Puia sp.]|nr:histidine kinase [Puia sp.]
MFAQYNLRGGFILSFCISVLASIPMLIRQNVGHFALNVLMLILPILLCWLIHHYFLLRDFGSVQRRPGTSRIVLSIMIGSLVVMGLAALRLEVEPAWGLDLPRPENAGRFLVFRSVLISAFTYFVVYYQQVNIQLQQSRLENEYLKQDQLKAQLFSLQQQLSPHFLFNSLSTLKTIAPDAGTKTYVMQLANVYRYLLSFHDSQKITLRDELAFTRSYLYILQERYEDALQVSIEIAERYLDYFLPPVTLQILIENALKHNVISMEQPLVLRIYTGEVVGAGSGATLTIENSFQPRLSVEESVGTGLQNINDRYKLLWGCGITVKQDGSLFIVVLPLLTGGGGGVRS